jgi:hypothetical protein
MFDHIDASAEFYSALRAQVFGDTDWKAEYQRTFASAKPRVNFQLDRPYDSTAPFVAYDFLVELYQLYGYPVHPVQLERGCIGIAVQLSSPMDYLGRDFRYLMLKDPEYHDLFRRFGVQAMFLHNFPSAGNDDNYSRFRTDELGTPRPY